MRIRRISSLPVALVVMFSCSSADGLPVRRPTNVCSSSSCRITSQINMVFSSSPSKIADDEVKKQWKPKTVVNRSPQEAMSLIQDIVRTAIDAGPRAAPTRTWQAYQAFASTGLEFWPQLAKPEGISFPKLVRTLFERMGATYIKLGQFIASSPTLFPREYVVEFQKCLDQTEPLPWLTIKRVIEDELGPISKNFVYVDPKPLASASIAQVHKATLKNGEQVVLKVQKPGIGESLQADLGFIYICARVLEFLQPDWERTSLAAVAGDIRASMLDELDFEKEARNTIEFRLFLQENNLLKKATAPRVYLNLTTKKVLTMELLNGVSMLDEDAILKVTKDPQIGTESVLTALNIWSMSVTGMPYFHADVHAGNLLLLDDGRVGFIDFGIVGRISEKVLRAVSELSTALAMNDSQGMAQALCNMGAADARVDIEKFGQDIDRLLQRLNNVQTTVNVMAMDDGTLRGRLDVDESEITDMLLEMVEITERNGLKLPREFGLLVKQTLYFDRYLKILAPSVDVLNDSRVMIGGKSRTKGINGSKEVIDV